MATFKEQQEKLTEYQHRLAVWEFLYHHLDTNYVSKDGRGVEKALRVPDCLVDVVPEDAIEDILQFIGSGPVADFREKIESIQNQEIQEEDNGTSRKK